MPMKTSTLALMLAFGCCATPAAAAPYVPSKIEAEPTAAAVPTAGEDDKPIFDAALAYEAKAIATQALSDAVDAVKDIKLQTTWTKIQTGLVGEDGKHERPTLNETVYIALPAVFFSGLAVAALRRRRAAARTSLV